MEREQRARKYHCPEEIGPPFRSENASALRVSTQRWTGANPASVKRKRNDSCQEYEAVADKSKWQENYSEGREDIPQPIALRIQFLRVEVHASFIGHFRLSDDAFPVVLKRAIVSGTEFGMGPALLWRDFSWVRPRGLKQFFFFLIRVNWFGPPLEFL